MEKRIHFDYVYMKQEAVRLKEKKIEERLISRVESYGGKCYKWISGETGVPDRIVIWKGGRVVFVETKKPKGGVLSDMQIYQQDEIKNRDAEVVNIKNYEEIEIFIDKMLKGEKLNEL